MMEASGVLGIVGAGTMGAGIAQVALEAGWGVRLQDAVPGAVERGRERIVDGLGRRARKLGLAEADATAWVGERVARLAEAWTPTDVAGGADLVIEAIIEDLEAKQALFTVLDAAADARAILATNTSALSVTAIAEAAVAHPERVLGLHFFNPAPILPLVEVVAGARTSADPLERATAIVTSWGKTAVACMDSPGFIVNRVNRPFTLKALQLLRAGAGTVKSIDDALTLAGFPMGPFELMDLVGLDINLATARNLFEAFDRAPRFRPSPIQESLVAEGHLGRKTGEGFYRHDANGRPVGVATRFAGQPGSDALDPARIAERVILAVVNEAYRALGEKVASVADIDLALKLGANHPIGPFEWAAETGLAEVTVMLDALTPEDADTFRPAIALLRAAAG